MTFLQQVILIIVGGLFSGSLGLAIIAWNRYRKKDNADARNLNIAGELNLSGGYERLLQEQSEYFKGLIGDLKIQIDEVRAENKVIRKENYNIQEENKKIREENFELKKKNEELLEEIHVLRIEVGKYQTVQNEQLEVAKTAITSTVEEQLDSVKNL